MRKIALAIGVLLTLSAAAPVAADRVKARDTQLALFQERTIFHSGLRNAHTIALTFDDGPNAHTDEVLDALKEMHVKATFFIVGNQAHRHPDMLARIAREGHLLANHSATHAYLGSRYDANPDRLLDQLRDVHEQIAPLMARATNSISARPMARGNPPMPTSSMPIPNCAAMSGRSTGTWAATSPCRATAM